MEERCSGRAEALQFPETFRSTVGLFKNTFIFYKKNSKTMLKFRNFKSKAQSAPARPKKILSDRGLAL
jgi:hypothetical protein